MKLKLKSSHPILIDPALVRSCCWAIFNSYDQWLFFNPTSSIVSGVDTNSLNRAGAVITHFNGYFFGSGLYCLKQFCLTIICSPIIVPTILIKSHHFNSWGLIFWPDVSTQKMPLYQAAIKNINLKGSETCFSCPKNLIEKRLWVQIYQSTFLPLFV